jgi:hypothetical protein
VFGAIAKRFLQRPDVESGTGFGGNAGLRIGGRIFAIYSDGSLVLKLPRERVESMVMSGRGTQFDPGHGRRMKEWVVIPAELRGEWQLLADEAIDFVEDLSRAG